MKNLKKRLPVLILAFLIAVMPLAMAVPANANCDVLNGIDVDRPASFTFDGQSFPFPSFLTPSDSFFVRNRNGVYSLIYADVAFFSFSPTSVSVYVSLVSPGSFFIYSFDGSSWVYSDSSVYGDTDVSFSCSVFGLYNIDSSLVTNNSYYSKFIPLVYSPSFVVSSPGIFSVFSGVSSWLAGAVNNMIPMFWTAESGLTPIGVLTVCSLALAVILLLFWLIAGWLKFK